jgi:hypothetical protein
VARSLINSSLSEWIWAVSHLTFASGFELIYYNYLSNYSNSSFRERGYAPVTFDTREVKSRALEKDVSPLIMTFFLIE